MSVVPPPGDEDGYERALYLDPDSGYPDGEDAWLAVVAGPVAEAYLDEQDTAAGVDAAEAFGAGFTHRGPGATVAGGGSPRVGRWTCWSRARCWACSWTGPGRAGWRC
jgi:hypothetical protein